MPPEPTPSDQWPIASYWPEHPEQHWYVCFCLLMSALQDCLSGQQMAALGNLNWAATCHYYSLVHTGRMLAFVIVGDYPKRHIDLRDFYCNTRDDVAYRMNWLNGFLRVQGNRRTEDHGPTFVQTDVFRTILGEMLGAAPFDLEVYATCLSRMAALRSDSNYEGLLIAHEKRHEIVERAFVALASEAEWVAGLALQLACSTYRAYIERSPLFERDRHSIIVISDVYVRGRLAQALLEKFGAIQRLEDCIADTCNRLVYGVPLQGQAYERIEERISVDLFYEKKCLMRDFEEKIASLSACHEQQKQGFGR